MKMLKISKLHANSKVEWDCSGDIKEGKVRTIMGTHASLIYANGIIYIVPIKQIRKKVNVI